MCYKKIQSSHNEIIYKFKKIKILFLRTKIQSHHNEIIY